ncbi:MAG: hypothetical protein ABJC26_01005 [Gemmatimonadaceae bacterium]
MRNWFAVVGVVCCGACGSSDSTAPNYGNISGRFQGEVSGQSQGQVLNGVYSIVTTQNGGKVSGTTEMNGFVGSGAGAPAFQNPGLVVGTIGSGEDPAVSFTITSNACPTHVVTLAGTYQTANKRLVVSGTLETYSSTCTVAYSFPASLLLTKPIN